MSEVLRQLVVALSLDSDNFSRNMRTINQQIKEAESSFRLAGAGVDNFENTVQGAQSRVSMLKDKLTQQNRAVEQYSCALDAANKKLTDSYTRQGKLESKLQDARAEMNRCKSVVDGARKTYKSFASALGESNAFTIAAKMNLEDAEQEYADASAEVKKLEGQIKSNSKTLQNNADAISKAKTNLNNAKAAVKDTEAEIEKTNKSLKTMQSVWTSAGKAMETFGTKCQSVGKSMTSTGKVLTATVTTPIVALGTAAAKASIDYESAFTSVRKTVDATEEEYAALSGEIKQMSTIVATGADDIAEVVAIAGQLGIANDYLTDFSRTMIDLGNSTDIVAEDAASTLAKFANITGMNQAEFSNLGSALVDLGNNYATTESEIMNMAMRLAAAGTQVGLSESQIVGFATALSSVGIEAEMGGSAFSKALTKMEVAAATGGQALDDFAKVSGMTSEQFKSLWDSDPAAAFQAFIVGLAKMDEEGESAIATLQEIGISEVRLRDTLLRSVNATELFSETQETANRAWEENSALTVEANKRYATTESRLKNLKNTAVLFAQQIGDDLNPTINNLIDGAGALLEKFLALDESQRMQIIQLAAVAAGAGPALTVFGKLTSGVGKVSSAIGKFSTAVGKAGGGFKGFMSVLGSSPAVWFTVAAAVVAGTVALVDYTSGAKQAREALEGMEKTAESWKNTAAETFYGKSEGLSFFGMSADDFQHAAEADADAAQAWVDGVIAVWKDGNKETDAIVSEWTNSFKNLTGSTRAELQKLQINADIAGNAALSDEIAADIAQLDAMDAEIEALLKKRQSKYFTEDDKIRLQELIDTREAIEVKYRLTEMDVDGFDTIAQKMEAAISRAQATGKSDADVSVYENAVVAAAEGMAAVNAELDAQYDAQYDIIRQMDDEVEKQKALALLNQQYNADRIAAAAEYAALLQAIVMPVWEQEDIQQASADVDELYQLLRQYSTVGEGEKPAILEQMNQLTEGMDEGALTEYVTMLTQIQSLLDSGMSEADVAAMFPEIDFSGALEQIAAIQEFVSNRSDTLPGLATMFGEALSEEVIRIATDLDMTGAQARWDEFAADPGKITTDAVVDSYDDAKAAAALQPIVDAWIAKYTEVPEGADKTELTPTGLWAYVTAYAEATTGTDVSGLTPDNVTAIVNAYEELASGADMTALTPYDIAAYISKYLEDEGVDTSGLTPENITAAVMAYEEVSGGASTAALTPSDIAAFVMKYLEADEVDISDLSEPQIYAIVDAYAEASNCDKSQLKAELTALITEYRNAEGVSAPRYITMTVSLVGYDMNAYNAFIRNNQVEVDGVVRLGETDLADNPQAILSNVGANVKFYENGIEIPASAVVPEQIDASTVAVLDDDGTMHILVTPEISGSEESIAAAREVLNQLTDVPGNIDYTLFEVIDLMVLGLEGLQNTLSTDSWRDLWGALDGAAWESANSALDASFTPSAISKISVYVSEVVAAIQSGAEVSAEDLENLQQIVKLLNLMELTNTGENIRAGIAEGMAENGWDADAENIVSDLEDALNSALDIHSPSGRMKPIGANTAAGVGAGMSEYDFTEDAGTMASNLFAAASAALAGSTLRPIGVQAMAGLTAGINAGRSGVISAMRSAAQDAVNAAKAQLKIHSPSQVFEDEVGVMTMRGWGKGVLKETKAQAKTIRNATRYLTGEAMNGSVSPISNDNRRTYNQNSSISFAGSNFYVRDSQDAYALAVEIAALTRRQQRGKGLRMA